MTASHHRQLNGFSLIATLLIIALMAVAIVGFLTVVGTETTTTHVSTQRAEARANAMVGLRKAIAQLQEFAGPDQRVTAMAAILDANPETDIVDDVPHAYWTGVWPTTPGADGDEEWIYRDRKSGSLRDHRRDLPTYSDKEDDAENQAEISAEKASRALTWLVSTPEDWLPTEDFPEDADDVVTMVGSYDPQGEDRPGEVKVRKVELNATGRGRTRTIGHYAYWVGDEGMKAKINTRNPYFDAPMEPAEADKGGYRKLYVAADADFSLLAGSDQLLEADKRKIVSRGRLGEFLRNVPQGQVGPRDTFYSITPYSLGVLCDVRKGGLKQNLSGYISSERSGGSGDAAIRDDTPLLEDFPGIGPNFDRLRVWTRAGKEVPFEDTSEKPEFGEHVRIDSSDAMDAYAGVSESVPDLAPATPSTMKPVLVEASMFFALSQVPHAEDSTQMRLFFHIYPRVVVWNPYAVKLEAKPYTVMVSLSSWQLNLRLADGSEQELRFVPPNTAPQSATANTTYCFALKPVDFEPGECLVFSPAHGGIKPYRTKNVGSNILSATNPSGTQNFVLEKGAPQGQTVFAKELAPQEFTLVGGQTPRDDRMVLKAANTASRYTLEQAIGFPAIQIVSGSSEPGMPRALPGSTDVAIPIPESVSPEPHYSTYEGFRMRWFEGDDSIALPMFLHNNFHGALSLRTPWDLAEDDGYDSRWNLYQRDAAREQLDLKHYSPRKLPGGKWGGNPFGDLNKWSLDRYVLFDLPRQSTGVLSLGQLQHAMLTKYMWHPSYAIGNSIRPARITDRTVTVPDFRGSESGWNAEMFASSDDSAKWFRSLVQNRQSDVLVYDLSFEANHALWDRFFLAPSNSSERRKFASGPAQNHLPNGRLRLNDFVPREGARANLTVPTRAASSLLVDGAFNVHSTQVNAWVTLLTTNREEPFAGEKHENQTPMPRFAHPASRKHQATEKAPGDSKVEYRVLSDGAIRNLAREIVIEVKKRAPFVSMADFVNRRLVDDETGDAGTLQAAIDRANLNGVKDSSAPEARADLGAPWTLMQADLLMPLGPILTARSDTFIIKAYGDAVGRNGKVVARAGCEAIVQRTPEPVEPGGGGLNPRDKNHLGRKFRIVSFRWTPPPG